jgi:hypothetical protein
LDRLSFISLKTSTSAVSSTMLPSEEAVALPPAGVASSPAAATEEDATAAEAAAEDSGEASPAGGIGMCGAAWRGNGGWSWLDGEALG